jgi:hypothetical protein
MKTLATLTTIMVLTLSVSALAQNNEMRADIDVDIPLAEAVERENEQFPDGQPLTEEELVAAVHAIKLKDPKITEAVYEIYQRVVKERVLPRGMYFSHFTAWHTEYGHFEVDWKDLTVTPLPPRTRDEKIGYGYNYRIRARFVSWRPLTEAERKRENAAQLKRQRDAAPAIQSAIPPRDSQASSLLLNLSSNYNGAFSRNWHGDQADNNLAELPTGLCRFDGVEFDVRGVVQAPLAGSETLPGGATNIIVGRACHRLHFLHAAINAGGLTNLTEVGRYIVHFEKGPDVEIPLRAGMELADWWQLPRDVAPRVPVAWTGQNGKARRSPGCFVRLFHLTWDNPKRGMVVRSIDLATTHAQARPFLVALTLE